MLLSIATGKTSQAYGRPSPRRKSSSADRSSTRLSRQDSAVGGKVEESFQDIAAVGQHWCSARIRRFGWGCWWANDAAALGAVHPTASQQPAVAPRQRHFSRQNFPPSQNSK